MTLGSHEVSEQLEEDMAQWPQAWDVRDEPSTQTWWDKQGRKERWQKRAVGKRTGGIEKNKGDTERPHYRSRLLGKKVAHASCENRHFAATRLGRAQTTVSKEAEKGDTWLLIADVARECFEAVVRPQVNAELPRRTLEDDDKEQDLVGHHVNFQTEVELFTVAFEFRKSINRISVYYHKKNDVKVIHGGDFVVSAVVWRCKWFCEQMDGRFDVNVSLECTGL